MTTNEKNELISRLQSATGLSADDKAALTRLLRTQQYGLVWEEKPEDVEELLRTQMPVLTEVKEKAIISDDPQAPDHILIEGDNLEALNALAYTHEGKIDVIYIDPPYNTGNKDFIYNDSFVDVEDGYRHSKWLSFMDKRLRLAKKMLSDKGVIFISIDEHEDAGLRMLCNNIFGESCFVNDISWQRTYSPRNDSKSIVTEVEHIYIYSKYEDWRPNKLPRTKEMDAKYKNPDNDFAPWRSDNPNAPGASTHQGMVYAIQHPFTGELIYPAIGACWRYQQDEMLSIMNGWTRYELKNLHDEKRRAEVCGIDENDVRKDVPAIMLSLSFEEAKAEASAVFARGQWPRFYFTKGGLGGIARKTYLENVEGKMPTNFWPHTECGHTDEAKKELMKILDGKNLFDTPKPVRLLTRVLQIASSQGSTILDFFAGSGTTLHATMQLNAEDGGHRQCILVTNNENNICEEVTYERNRRVIQGYTNAKGQQVEGLTNNNLRYYRVEHVARQNDNRTLRELMQKSTDLLCIKEGVYHEEREFAGLKFKPSVARYFHEGERRMLVIYNELAVAPIAARVAECGATKEHPLKVYVFSNGRYAYEDELHAVATLVEVCAMPEALLQSMQSTLPPLHYGEEDYTPDAEAEAEALADNYNYKEEGGEA